MTDRELLELAAKAAGYGEVWYLEGHDTPYIGPRYEVGKAIQYTTFMPLTDDGDALRLAVKLGIDLEWRRDGRVAAYRHATSHGHCFTAFESSREDRNANTRRAITRAAAEIGRNKP